MVTVVALAVECWLYPMSGIPVRPVTMSLHATVATSEGGVNISTSVISTCGWGQCLVGEGHHGGGHMGDCLCPAFLGDDSYDRHYPQRQQPGG